jgi:hypothetical protein
MAFLFQGGKDKFQQPHDKNIFQQKSPDKTGAKVQNRPSWI